MASDYSALHDYLLADNQLATTFGELEDEEDDSDASQRRYIAYLLKAAPAIEGRHGDDHTVHTAREGKLYGLSINTTHSLMLEYWNIRCIPPWDSADLLTKVESIYKSTKSAQGCLNAVRAFRSIDSPTYTNELEKLEATRAGAMSAATRNGMLILTSTIKNGSTCFFEKTWIPPRKAELDRCDNPLYRLIRYNDFANKIEFTRPAPWHMEEFPMQFWDDNESIDCRAWLNYNRNLDLTAPVMDDTALAVARFYRYHPVRDWLKSLKWDGVSRIDTWLEDYCGASDSPYTRTVGKCTLIAAVARVMAPGCQHDSMLVLEGEQGTGKTSVVRILGGAWYADIKIDPGSIDTIHAMRGKWILEASELEFAKRVEVQAIKRFLTLTTDVGRLKFGRHSSDLPRQSIFIGTINPGGKPAYLADSDGNRRYWPVLTRTIALQRLRKDRDQLFAEAFIRYSRNEIWNLQDPKVIIMANNETAYRVDTDAWQDVIAKWLNYEDLPDILDTKTIAYGALNLQSRELDRFNSNRIGKCLKNLGYNLVQKRFNGTRYWVWEPNELEGL